MMYNSACGSTCNCHILSDLLVSFRMVDVCRKYTSNIHTIIQDYSTDLRNLFHRKWTLYVSVDAAKLKQKKDNPRM